jgi:hypothetical protein
VPAILPARDAFGVVGGGREGEISLREEMKGWRKV